MFRTMPTHGGTSRCDPSLSSASNTNVSPRPRSRTAAALVQVAADQERRVGAGLEQDPDEHRRGGRLPMGPRDRDDAPPDGERRDRLLAAPHRDPALVRRDDLRVGGRDRARDHDHVGLTERRRVVPDPDRRCPAPRAPRGRASPSCRIPVTASPRDARTRARFRMPAPPTPTRWIDRTSSSDGTGNVGIDPVGGDQRPAITGSPPPGRARRCPPRPPAGPTRASPWPSRRASHRHPRAPGCQPPWRPP